MTAGARGRTSSGYTHNMNTEMTLSDDVLPMAHTTAMEADCRTRGAEAARGTT